MENSDGEENPIERKGSDEGRAKIRRVDGNVKAKVEKAVTKEFCKLNY